MTPESVRQAPLQDIYGRDLFVARLWRTLEGRSLRIEAERRIGKTSILKKMNAEPQKDWEPIFLDLERVHSAAEFAEIVCAEIHKKLTGWKKQGNRLLSIIGGIGVTHIGPIKFPDKKDRPEGYWKKLLTNGVEDLLEQQVSAGKRVVFLFDEMPWMLEAIADPDRDGPQIAMEVLDVLRSMRQSPTTGQSFRMILCGSIGMHHILAALKKKGYKNQPVNDMEMVEVPPLDPVDAEQLASHLLAKEGLKADDPSVPARIAEKTGCFPYYIHWVVSKLGISRRSSVVNPEDIDLAIKELLTGEHDPCDLLHFKTRIHGYYPGQENVVLGLLDHAALATSPLPQSELIGIAKTAGASDENQIRELLRLLLVDHYLRRDTEGCYSFRHELLRRWWVIEQGLN